MSFKVDPLKTLKYFLQICLLATLVSCSNNNFLSASTDKASSKKVASLKFKEISLSRTDKEISSMRISPLLSVTYDDGSVTNHPLSYHPLIKTGDKLGSNIFGLITDAQGSAIVEKDGSNFISQDPDGNSFISAGGKHYLVTHMESMPGSIYKTELRLNNQRLEAVSTEPVDLKNVDGNVINCASSKTPWNTHIGGEEDFNLNSIYSLAESPYYQNCAIKNGRISNALVTGTRSYFCSYVSGMQSYLNDLTIDKTNGYNGKKFSPYNYGYTIEVAINAGTGRNDDSTTTAARHYVTGKYSPELGLAMPDKKTIYMSDDGNAKGFWKFVSDTKIEGFKKNWEGTLYAAKVKQLSNENGGSFSMRWVKLGHASDFEIKSWIDEKLKITDIFDVAFPEKFAECPNGYTRIYEDRNISCLRLKKGQERVAAFLESRKYAAYLGATLEFKKEEGLAYDPVNKKLYVAITQISGGMLDNYKKIETNNHIRLPINLCGGIYELNLNDAYSATSMKAVLTGKPLKVGEKYAEDHFCSPEKIANPDNLSFLGSNTLLISEDGVQHLNNMSWAYDVKTKQLTRIASLPIGAELTGVTHATVGSKGFLFMTQQHPFVDQPVNAKREKIHANLFEQASDDDLNAIVGYIAGFPPKVLLD